MHGNQDALVPYCVSAFLQSALQNKGLKSQYILIPNGQHGGNITQSSANISTMVQFFLREQTNTVTAVNDVLHENNIGLYLDGSTSILHILGGVELTNASFEIMDLSGKKIKSGLAYGNEINVSTLNQGAYIIKVLLSDRKIIASKFIK